MDSIRGDILTSARIKRQDIRIEESNRGGVSFCTDEMPIDFYVRRGLISKAEFRAGNKLYTDFFLSGQTPGIISNPNPVKNGKRDFTERQLQARENWRCAIEAIHGQVARLIVIDVCCYGLWLKETSYKHYSNSQQAMARFHEAMDELIEYYDLTRNSR